MYDPIDGRYLPNGQSLEFRTSSGNSGGESGGVLIDNDPELLPDQMTVECFARLDNTSDQTSWQNILTKMQSKDEAKSGFVLVYLAPKSVEAVFYGFVEDGGTNVQKSVALVANDQSDFDNGKWHHLAVTVDTVTKTVKLYVDYKLKVTKTGADFPFDIRPDASTPWSVGYGYGLNWGRWCGFVDEFRISNAILEPRQFLRVRHFDSSPVLPETVIYQPFNTYDFLSGFEGQLMANEAIGSGSLGEPTIKAHGQPVTNQTETAVCNITTQEGRIPNCEALALRSTEASRAGSGGYQQATTSWSFADPEATLLDGDFTAEMFLRTSDGMDGDQKYLMSFHDFFHLTLTGGIRLNWSAPFPNTAFEDGFWHHVAMVYRKDQALVEVFADYRSVGTKSVTVDPAKANGLLTFNGYSTYYNETVYDTDVDDVRITKKALAPTEFLHPSEKDVLWHLDFDGTSVIGARAWNTPPDDTTCGHALDSEIRPSACVAEGLLAEPRTNCASLRTIPDSRGRSGGLRLPDPNWALPSGSFTAELEYRLEKDAYRDLTDDPVYLFCQLGWYVCISKADGKLIFYDSDWKAFAQVKDGTTADGNWHHVAFVQDKEHGELQAYYDHRLVGTGTSMLKGGEAIELSGHQQYLWVGNGLWGYPSLTFNVAWIDNVRVTQRVLKPCEFIASRPLVSTTLAWAAFDGDFTLMPDLGVGAAWWMSSFQTVRPGRIGDGQGIPFRPRNSQSLNVSSGGVTYNRLSVLERPDLTVEFFLRGTSASDGTDLVKLAGSDGTTPIWSLRQVGGEMKVVIADGEGRVSEVASAGVLPEKWTHVALVFEPNAEGSATDVKVYRDHEPCGTVGSFSGTLSVDGVKTSSLQVGKFMGSIDELRISRGVVDPKDMLHVLSPMGLTVLVR